jgi:hypothetical protein
MRTTKLTCLALLLLTALHARALPARTDINPALLYYLGFLAAPASLSDADETYLESLAGWQDGDGPRECRSGVLNRAASSRRIFMVGNGRQDDVYAAKPQTRC